jgi:uncharacterized Zn finger protein
LKILKINMKCNCGQEIMIRMAAKVRGDGCKILTAMRTVVTAQCENCGKAMQVPIQSDNVVVNEN